MNRRAAAIALICAVSAPAIGLAQERGALLGRLRERIAERRSNDDSRNVERMMLGGVSVAVWRPPAAKSPSPLVIFSHGFHGMAVQSRFLTSALAAHGYLVIAPDHRDSLRGQLESRGGWKAETPLGSPHLWTEDTYRDRQADIAAIVKELRESPAWAGAVDWSRFALAGHSLGGYTALGIAGAWPSWQLPGVKAVLALSPYAQPFANQKKLGAIRVPVMYQSGNRDPGITPFLTRPGGAFDQTAGPAYLVVFDGANHFSFSDASRVAHDEIVAYSLAFLDRHVNGDRAANPAQRRPGVGVLRSK